jgi:hypothetical protein
MSTVNDTQEENNFVDNSFVIIYSEQNVSVIDKVLYTSLNASLMHNVPYYPVSLLAPNELRKFPFP